MPRPEKFIRDLAIGPLPALRPLAPGSLRLGDDLRAQLGVALDGPPVRCGASALLKKDEDRRH